MLRLSVCVRVFAMCTTLYTARFGLAKYYASSMVLQRAPAKPRIWGYADMTGNVVAVTISGLQTVVANATDGTFHDPQTKFSPSI